MTTSCTECICYEDLNCVASLELMGNGFCNDEANTPGCNYDGGDCCGACVNTELCIGCICHEGGEPAIDFSCKISVMYKPNFFLNEALNSFLALFQSL